MTISIRPENISLSEDPPAGGDSLNRCIGVVDQKVFLGDFIDFRIKVGDTMVLARGHPMLRTPVGDSVNLRIDPENCIVLAPDEPSERAP
ncbi:MAG: TOBE domain-containing protein [Proteobacteria bacterium]|nr:TOBE domain-containing protein [Pseudomonadota bacterium]